MFTGIIQEIGKVKNVEKREKITIFTISAKKVLANKEIGGSIAINGACTTITTMTDNEFTCDVIPETLEKTNLSDIQTGYQVNLEAALTLNQGIDGHLVQGHVDTTGTVESLDQSSERTILTIKFPQEITRHLAFKGSITINGVSLTISDLQEETLSVELIPHTLERTNFPNLKPGDKVNLEVDLISRYLDRLLENRNTEAKYEYLKERNLL